MNRKSLIICLAVLATMILGIGIAVGVLYSGSGGKSVHKNDVVSDSKRFMLLPAVPADAVFVACFSEAEKAFSTILSGFKFPASLADSLKTEPFKGIDSSPFAVSLHYDGSLQALYVFDVGQANPQPTLEAEHLMHFARSKGLYADFVNGEDIPDVGRGISERSLILISDSETLLKSSKRHLDKSVSVMDAAGFAEASAAASGGNIMFFSNAHSRVLASGMFSKKYAAFHQFISTMSLWTVAEFSKSDASGTYMDIIPVFSSDPSEFSTVISESSGAASKLSGILPSYTISAVSLPMKDAESYISAYEDYMDSKQALQAYRKKQKSLETKVGISPKDFVKSLDVREMAKASFVIGAAKEEVNLMRINREDTLIFIGMKNKSFKEYVPAIHNWPYSSFASSVFGKYFELKDESCFTYIDGWIISGSMKAVESYVSGMALDYTLLQYMANAGQKDMLSSTASPMLVYYSFTEPDNGNAAVFSKAFAKALEPLYQGADYCPLLIAAENGKSGLKFRVQMPKLTMMREKAPEFERDTTVYIPQGPFRVKNSGTGKNNLFYQNSHSAICLKEEGGKDLWGIPFDGKLCGRAYNVDYYANGKLQIIFASGSKIYIIDRLSRYVRGFPLDLGKEILLGPDIYDFNGQRAYNIMVLHKDNSIEMYNLKGKKPSSWKTIKAPETVKNLPERIEVGGRTFWIVRTSVQTLIYPFGGGDALISFKGDEMLKPDTKIEIIDGTSVSGQSYDGKKRTVKLF